MNNGQRTQRERRSRAPERGHEAAGHLQETIMDSSKTIIEVNGVKLEVDLRTAKRVDELRVGDRVKVLVSEGYSEKEHKVYPGTVIGFEPFETLPTIIVAYLVSDWLNIGVKFLYFNAQTKDAEIIKAVDNDHLDINKADVLQKFDREIQKQRDALEDIERKKAFFLANFNAYWPGMQRVTTG